MKKSIVLFVLLGTLFYAQSCFNKLEFENKPREDTPVFQYYYEYVFDDEFLCDTTYVEFRSFDYIHWRFPRFLPRFHGVTYMGNFDLAREGIHKIDYSNLDYNNLSFYVELYFRHITEDNQLVDRQEIEFCFTSNDSCPFREGEVYSWPSDFITDPTGRNVVNAHVVSERKPGWQKWRPVQSKALSSSFRFKYREIENGFVYKEITDEYTKDVLDVYFDFELVVLNVMDDLGPEVLPNVGDTIRIKNGHFIQSLYCYDTDFLHQLIVPNEETR